MYEVPVLYLFAFQMQFVSFPMTSLRASPQHAQPLYLH